MIEIVPCNSDPSTADSDGDGVDDKHDLNPCSQASYINDYMVADSLNYDFYSAFIDNEIKEKRELSNQLYNSIQYSDDEINRLEWKKTYAYLVVAGGSGSLIGTNAAWALSWYLSGSGMDKKLSLEAMISYVATDYGHSCYRRELEKAAKFGEDVLKDGESITIVSKHSFETYKTDAFKLSLFSLNDINWIATLGGASGALAAEITRDGNSYTMKYKYIIYDYYDWDLGDDRAFVPGLCNDDLARMQCAGMAKAYYHYGELTDYYWWD